MALVSQELCETLAKVRLKSDILTLKQVHKLRILPLETRHVSEVDIHGARFVVFDVLRGPLIVVNLSVTLLL